MPTRDAEVGSVAQTGPNTKAPGTGIWNSQEEEKTPKANITSLTTVLKVNPAFQHPASIVKLPLSQITKPENGGTKCGDGCK